MSPEAASGERGSVIRFVVYGRPVPKARPRVVRRGDRVTTYTPKSTAAWEDMIRYQALEHRPPRLLDGPIAVRATFYLARPKSRRGMWADRKPDWDNLAKAVTDALEGLFWANDSRLVDVQVRKMYGDPPRVEIEVEELPRRGSLRGG